MAEYALRGKPDGGGVSTSQVDGGSADPAHKGEARRSADPHSGSINDTSETDPDHAIQQARAQINVEQEMDFIHLREPLLDD